MYGVVLMVAMTTGSEAPELGGRGCKGCQGYSSCKGQREKRSKGCKGCKGYTQHCGCGCYTAPACCVPAPVCGCYGAPVMHGGGQIIIEGDNKGGKDIEKIKKKPKGGDNDEVIDAPALITINVPANARLLIDGVATTSTSESRTFESPTLISGKSYSYTFQAEFVRDGKTVVVTRNVKVQAGAEINVSMLQANTAVASR